LTYRTSIALYVIAVKVVMEVFIVTTMPSRSEHLKDMAWECRQLASVTSDRGVRLDLLLVAEKFERLAQARDSEWGTKLPETSTPANLKSSH
jgi:hypothetical protein